MLSLDTLVEVWDTMCLKKTTQIIHIRGFPQPLQSTPIERVAYVLAQKD